MPYLWVLAETYPEYHTLWIRRISFLDLTFRRRARYPSGGIRGRLVCSRKRYNISVSFEEQFIPISKELHV